MPTFSSQQPPSELAAETPGEASATPASAASPPPSPWRIVGIYTAVAVLWIFGSDRVLQLLYEHPQDIIRWSVYKGIAFVVVTATLLLFLVRRAFRRIAVEQANTLAKESALRASDAQMAEMINAAIDAIVAVNSDERA